ncbi:MAG: carbohydrate ABC transporter permease [Oscillospiraceae bacterium]|nr:carbohydrate ABC transporter permease [Oscillospiraceae bacterium]
MVESKKFEVGSLVICYIIMAIVLVLTVYPLLWMIFSSCKTVNEFYTNSWLPPVQWYFGNFITAWTRAKMGVRYLNSLLITGTYLLINIPVSMCASYSFSRLQFKGRKKLYTAMLSGILIPTGVLTLPIYSVMVNFRLINNRIGLAFVYAGMSVAFSTFIMHTFFVSLPKGLEEAATIDGCSRFGAFARVIVPLTKPGIMILLIYNGISNWGEYHLASLVLTTNAKQTVPVGMALFQDNQAIEYTVLFAALTLATVPLVVLYVFCQKAFITGMTAGAVKG